MKALITGICGFVGGHLTRLLLSRGHEVVGLDVGDRESAFDLGTREVKVFKGDLRDEDVISKTLTEFKPDTVFHLAAQSSVKLSFENPFETFSANLIGTLVLLETISKLDMPVKTLIISSSEVYGRLKPEECPVTEDHPLQPINPYAVSKASVDLLAQQYFLAYRMPVYIARAFSHSGPGQKTVAVLSDWAFQIAKIDLGLSPAQLKVGNTKVQRDYADVRDVVKAYVDIIEKGKAGKPYNVCSGKGYKLSDLLDKYRSLTDKEVEVATDKSRMRPVDIPILIGSYERLSADTGWKPTIPIETTLSDSLKFWRDHLAEEVEET
jgi:GDP-4-dehydro-6-deoxy-D-mannose reductase